MSTQPTSKLSELFDLSGKTAVVTGAAAGIGQAVAARLCEAGAHVVAGDIDEAGAQRTAAALRERGGSAEAQRMDVAEAGVGEVIAEVAAARGRLDILVNNAGVYPMRPFLEADDALWQRTLEVNLLGAARCARAALPHMLRAGSAIVNVASIDGLRPSAPHLTHYGAAKAALMGLTRGLAWELRGKGVRVNAVAPGAIQTPGTAAMLPAPRDDKEREKMELMERAFLGRIPARRRGQPDDVARVVVFLASPMAEYMTGETVVVDGGFLLS